MIAISNGGRRKAECFLVMLFDFFSRSGAGGQVPIFYLFSLCHMNCVITSRRR